MQELSRINMARAEKHEKFIRLHYGKYADDVPRLDTIRKMAAADMRVIKKMLTGFIVEVCPALVACALSF